VIEDSLPGVRGARAAHEGVGSDKRTPFRTCTRLMPSRKAS
jgi:hypothetical protein